MSKHEEFSEAKKSEKIKKRLLIVGVVCIVAAVFTLWIIKLPSTLRRNREALPGTFSGLKGINVELGEQWNRFLRKTPPTP